VRSETMKAIPMHEAGKIIEKMSSWIYYAREIEHIMLCQEDDCLA
jgi:hypothetical protein